MYSGQITFRLVKVLDQARLYWIASRNEQDRYLCGYVLCRERWNSSTSRDDNRYAARHQSPSQIWKSLDFSIRPLKFDGKISTFNHAGLLQTLSESIH